MKKILNYNENETQVLNYNKEDKQELINFFIMIKDKLILFKEDDKYARTTNKLTEIADKIKFSIKENSNLALNRDDFIFIIEYIIIVHNECIKSENKNTDLYTENETDIIKSTYRTFEIRNPLWNIYC